MQLIEVIKNISIKKKECLKTIQQLKNEYNQLNNNEPLIIRRLKKESIKRLERIEKYLEVEKYNIYFSGTVGVGKTTIISLLLDLIDSSAKNYKHYALLPTGSGRTTICETKFVIGNAFKITFIPVSNENFNLYLNDWAYLSKDNLAGNNKIDLPEEISNWIINSMGFKNKCDDELKILIEDSKDSNELFEKCKDKIKYEERIGLINDVYKNKIEFCKCFKELNNGTNVKFKMPKSIELTIPIENEDLKSVLNSIIDTKGIESPARPDIREHIEIEPDSISVMCDGINDYCSNSILELLRLVLNKENSDLKNRVILLGIDRNNDLSYVNGADGNSDEGQKIKIKEAKETFLKNKVCFNENNYIFCSSLENSTNKDGTVDISKIRSSSESLYSELLEKSINNMIANYDIEISEISTFLKKIECNKLNDSFIEIIKKLNKRIVEIFNEWSQTSDKTIIWDEFQSQLDNRVNIKCASSLRGAVNHNGIGNTANIYEVLKNGAYQYYRKAFEKVRIMIEEFCKAIGDLGNDIENECFKYICNLITEVYYDECYREYANTINQINDCLMNNDKFWIQPKGYWGDGKGDYIDRIQKFIKKEMENEDYISRNNSIGKYEQRDEASMLYTYFKKVFDLLNIE